MHIVRKSHAVYDVARSLANVGEELQVMTLLHTHNYIFVSVAEYELTNSVAFHQQAATILIVMSWDKKLHQQFPFHATNSTIFYIKLSIMCKLSHRKFYILHV